MISLEKIIEEKVYEVEVDFPGNINSLHSRMKNRSGFKYINKRGDKVFAVFDREPSKTATAALKAAAKQPDLPVQAPTDLRNVGPGPAAPGGRKTR